MLKVIIIDDEPITRKGLIEYVDWSRHDMKIFGEAEDGLEALKLADNVQPDLAICDIKMPKMNGIEFATQIKFVAPHCKIIFLSGYTDKEYLKSAIKLNVIDYLEKPINMEELSDLLNIVRDSHQAQIDQFNTKNKLKARMNQSNQYLLNSLIDDLIKGDLSASESTDTLFNHLGLSFPMNSMYRLVVVKFDNMSTNISFIASLLHEKLLEVASFSTILGYSGNKIKIVHAHNIEEEHLKAFYNTFFEAIFNKYGSIVEIGLGKKVGSFAEMKSSYSDALDAIEWKGFSNKNKIVTFEKNDSSLSIIRDTQKFINENFDKSITIKDISDSVFLTPQYLCKIYKNETGTTINTHITDLRMERAKELLLDRNLMLYEVAVKVGYQDSNYFSRVFRRYFDMNPSEYRDKHNV